MTVTAAQENFGIALQLGGSYARAEFFEFLDNTIRSTKIIEKPSSQADDLLKEVVQGANKQVGRSLAKPVPVVVSFAGPVKEDAKTATPSNFEINGGKEAINLEEHLNGINLDGVKFEVKVLNDAAALINAAAISNKNLLEPGDKVYHAIMGTGMGGAGGTIAKDGGVTEINANEPGHEIMPDLDKYRFIEGTARQQIASPLTKKNGYVELYTAGGNSDDRGLVATLNNFRDMMHAPGTSQEEGRFFEAIDLLKQTLKENSVEGFENMLTATIGNSRVIQKDFTLSNKNITKAAKDGDEFAKALVTFTLIRASQALAQSINSQGQDKPVALVSINGSFNRGLREAVDPNGDLQFRVVNAELKKLGHPGIKDNDPNRLVQFDPELDGTPLILEKQFQNDRGLNDRGLVATVNYFKTMMNAPASSQLGRSFIPALDLLDKTLEHSVGDSNKINTQTVTRSRIMQEGFPLSDENIIKAADSGDKFAQALVTSTLIRAAQEEAAALAQSMNSSRQDQPVLVSIPWQRS